MSILFMIKGLWSAYFVFVVTIMKNRGKKIYYKFDLNICMWPQEGHMVFFYCDLVSSIVAKFNDEFICFVSFFHEK